MSLEKVEIFICLFLVHELSLSSPRLRRFRAFDVL